MSRIVYLTEEQIDNLLGVAHRINAANWHNDAQILFSLLDKQEGAA